MLTAGGPILGCASLRPAADDEVYLVGDDGRVNSIQKAALSRIAESAELKPTTVAKARAGVVQINVIAPRQQPNDALLRALECEINPDAGFVATDQFGQTSVSGVWAPGNVATPSAEVITEARAGSASAIAINGWLL